MPFANTLDIGPPGRPDYINAECIKRVQRIPNTDQWKIWDTLTPDQDDIPITITDEQYQQLVLMLEPEPSFEPVSITRY